MGERDGRGHGQRPPLSNFRKIYPRETARGVRHLGTPLTFDDFSECICYLSRSSNGSSRDLRDCDPMRAGCVLQFRIIAIVLLAVSKGELSQRLVENITLTDITSNHCGVS